MCRKIRITSMFFLFLMSLYYFLLMKLNSLHFMELLSLSSVSFLPPMDFFLWNFHGKPANVRWTVVKAKIGQCHAKPISIHCPLISLHTKDSFGGGRKREGYITTKENRSSLKIISWKSALNRCLQLSPDRVYKIITLRSMIMRKG